MQASDVTLVGFVGLSCLLAACSSSSEGGDRARPGDAAAGGSAATGGSGASSGGASGSGGLVGSGGRAVGGTGSADPCAGRPADCVTVCQAGDCQCECGVPPGCPNTEPPEGNGCNATELCSYGTADCRRIFECSAGAWVVAADTCLDTRVGSCPATAADALAVACLGRSCGYDGVVCDCYSPTCSGAFLEPYTQCRAPTPAVCQLSISDGARCLTEGQVCGSTCCGRSHTCTDGRWVGQDNPCPP